MCRGPPRRSGQNEGNRGVQGRNDVGRRGPRRLFGARRRGQRGHESDERIAEGSEGGSEGSARCRVEELLTRGRRDRDRAESREEGGQGRRAGSARFRGRHRAVQGRNVLARGVNAGCVFSPRWRGENDQAIRAASRGDPRESAGYAGGWPVMGCASGSCCFGCSLIA